MRVVHLTPHIRFQVPDDWEELSRVKGKIRLRPPVGGIFSAQAWDLRKRAKPEMGSGPRSEELVAMQVSKFEVSTRLLAPGRAFATHSVQIGEPGEETECRAWHLVNQAGPWHHQALLFTYEPPYEANAGESVLSFLDEYLPQCEFDDEVVDDADISMTSTPQHPKRPWWQFW